MVYDPERRRRAREFGGTEVPALTDPRWVPWADRFLTLLGDEGARFRELAYATGSHVKARNLLAYLEAHELAQFRAGRWTATLS